MIASFRHKGLRKFYETGNRAGIQPHHADRLQYFLLVLNTAEIVEDMDLPGAHFHQLHGAKIPRWAVNVNANWRLTFEFNQGSAYLIDYEDYH
jgi:proteic killer suppression protein